MLSAAPSNPVVEPARAAYASESAFDATRSGLRVLRPKGLPQAWLALRPAGGSDGDALQNYFRALSPQSRYNRVLIAANELAPAELARALAANGRETATLLLTWRAETRETVVGETRMALSCAERTAEFSMSIADDWRRLGVGSALLEEIERRAAADGIEWLFGDVLRTNEAMIALARRRGFRLEMGLEGRLLRIQKRLDDAAPDPPCRQWAEIVASDRPSYGRPQ
jgi:GNAT superfamily N-acetyltransferase